MGLAADALLAFVDRDADPEERKTGALLLAEGLLQFLGWRPLE